MNPLLKNQVNPMQMMEQMKNNPVQFLMNRGLNIPQGMNNPQEMVQHLLNTGQVSQQQYENALSKVKNFRM
jgi:hypothetical protein